MDANMIEKTNAAPGAIDALVASWHRDIEIDPNVAAWRTQPARAAQFALFPDDLHPALIESLRARGITALYSHQAMAWQETRAGKHVVVVTGTASGKTLCYNLPVLDRLLRDPHARALYLFPTKALAQDQVANLKDEVRKTLAPHVTAGSDRSHAGVKDENASSSFILHPSSFRL
jgi:DEAD/DEAH box helicase domain-containing protein